MTKYWQAQFETLRLINQHLGLEPMTTESEFDRIIERDRARDVDKLCEPELVEYPDPELVESEDDDD